MTLAGGLATSSEFAPAGLANFSGMAGFSKYLYFISENYLALPTEQFSDPFFAGFSGLRLISKKRDVQSVQFGFMYVVSPSFTFTVPGISYTLKFGKVY